ncbi:hypothetical protein C8R47DRAFT_1168963 [Mycena vitilis]|nr:hypothetical protein C8R47DRAFT_1168963 [Mycena vitilis]
MHPALEISNLQRLPSHSRRVALAACKSDATFDDLVRADKAAERSSDAQRICFLPIFFTHVDPTQIPSLEEVETRDPATENRLACATLALRSIFDMSVGDADKELWPRIWPWLQFVSDNHEHLPAACGARPDLLLFQFVGFVAQNYCYISPPSIPQFVSSTPGFRVLIGRTWMLLSVLQQAKPETFEAVHNYLCRLLIVLDFVDEGNFEEIIEGAGGTLDDLAALAVKFVHDVLDGRHTWTLAPHSFYIGVLMRFIQTGHSGDNTNHTSPPLQEKFVGSLRRNKFVPALVTAMASLVTVTADMEARESIRHSLILLERLLTAPSWYLLLPDALDAGLLRMLLNCAMRFGSYFDYHLEYLMEKLMVGGLVYYRVVAATKRAVVDAEKISSTRKFEALDIYDHWITFTMVVEERLALKKHVDRVGVTRACDNIECAQVQGSAQRRRCSGCDAFYYCSTDCQVVDWKKGGHRKNCRLYNIMSLAKSPACPLSFHERKFMRSLVQRDYHENIRTVCKMHVAAIAGDPDGSAVIVTGFDYTLNEVQISATSVAHWPAAAFRRHTMGPEWKDMVARAAKTWGRIQLCVMVVPEGNNNTRLWVVPLRMESSKLSDALLDLGSNVPYECDEEFFADEVEAIVDEHYECVSW